MQHQAGDEPVPGYALRQRLCVGEAGELWRADGPGGVACAVRILDLGTPAGERMRRAVGLFLGVRHPHLVPVLGVWERPALVIALGWADQTLAGWREFTPDGVPAAALLSHTADAADGLDALHAAGLTHCDVRPSNLLLVGGRIQVGDTANLLAVGPADERSMAVGTAAYAAPELINNQPGLATDQYALAITYYELRTGQLPFRDENALMAHLMGQLDFGRVPATERAVLETATAVRPADRYPTCRMFAEALRAAVGPPPAARVPRPSPLRHPPPAPGATRAVPAGFTATRMAGATKSRTAPPAETVRRRATVRHYSRMAPERSYPFLVVLSAAEIAKVQQKGVAQTEGAAFEVAADATLEVEPVLPGCDVYPPREHLTVAADTATAKFWVVPHVLGRVNGAKVCVRVGGRVVSEVTLDVKVRKQTLTVLFGSAGMASPYLMAGLKKLDLDPAAQQAQGFPAVYALLPLLRPDVVAGVLLVAAVACWWLLRPKKRDVFWDVEPA